MWSCRNRTQLIKSGAHVMVTAACLPCRYLTNQAHNPQPQTCPPSATRTRHTMSHHVTPDLS